MGGLHGDTVKDITEVVQDIYKFSDYYVNMVLHKEPDNDLLEWFNFSREKTLGKMRA